MPRPYVFASDCVSITADSLLASVAAGRIRRRCRPPAAPAAHRRSARSWPSTACRRCTRAATVGARRNAGAEAVQDIDMPRVPPRRPGPPGFAPASLIGTSNASAGFERQGADVPEGGQRVASCAASGNASAPASRADAAASPEPHPPRRHDRRRRRDRPLDGLRAANADASAACKPASAEVRKRSRASKKRDTHGAVAATASNTQAGASSVRSRVCRLRRNDRQRDRAGGQIDRSAQPLHRVRRRLAHRKRRGTRRGGGGPRSPRPAPPRFARSTPAS